MRRSGGVTAAAVILFIGSGFCLVLSIPVMLASVAVASSGRSFTQGYEFLAALFALEIWQICTGIGVLRLRRWAWVSIVVMSGAALFVAYFGIFAAANVPALMDDPQLNKSVVNLVAFGIATAFAAQAGISIWWFVLFTRDNVRRQFAAELASCVEIPTSIRVIAILSLTGAGFLLLSFTRILRNRDPLVIFGMLTSGTAVVFYGIALVTTQIVLAVCVLHKRSWAVDWMIWYAVVNIVNATLCVSSSARARFLEITDRNSDVPAGVSPQALRNFHHFVLYPGYAFGIGSGIICIYFLITRRKAFRAACEASARRREQKAVSCP